MHEGRGIADILVGLIIFLLQYLQDTGVTTNSWIVAFRNQVVDLRRLLLAIAINTTITLLEDHQ